MNRTAHSADRIRNRATIAKVYLCGRLKLRPDAVLARRMSKWSHNRHVEITKPSGAILGPALEERSARPSMIA